MGGGLMQLVAYGAQDIYLTGNPQITFFKVVYRRHTNFSIECIEQTFNGSTSAGASTVTATISRNGDLISNMHLDVKLPAEESNVKSSTYVNWTNNTGHAYVDNVELEIGGQRIDKHYGHWLDVYNELTDHDGHERPLINKHSAKNSYLKSSTSATTKALQMYIPLKFWFNRNPGLALPLIALQYHEVKIKLTTRDLNNLINTDGNSLGLVAPPLTTLWVDYIYLDTDERRRFAQQSHEYLIEQLQYSTESGPTSLEGVSVSLNLNHPVKELIWTVQDATVNTAGTSSINATANIAGSDIANRNDWFNYDGNSGDCFDVINGATSNEGFSTLKLQLNGHDRFSARNASYFRTVQPLQAGHVVPEKHVYCYSFALKPEEHQPSGTCNFSRIDNAKMVFGNVLANTNIHVYAVNYNVLRIMSGMGGLAYSN